jgi:GT2 family glycosyltransferase
MSGASSARVVAVVVAYNRRELLAECLSALEAQTQSMSAIVVVDNASTDGSPDMVAERFPAVDLVRLSANTGGAGGFAVGIDRALEAHRADLVWIMDDDTVPEPTALEHLLTVRESRPSLALLASRAVWTDGVDHPMNTPKKRLGAASESVASAARHGCVPVRSASFVSSLVAADAIRVAGLPVADYFIWNDDFEFTARILRRREGWYCPSSVVTHKTKVFGSSDADPGERFYFEVRNKVWLFRFSPAFAIGERLLYMGATARRWARTWWRSRDRAVLGAAGRRGWRDGWRARPRSNAQVLAPALASAEGAEG